MMLLDVIAVKVLAPYKLYVRFEDGMSGEVDVAKITLFKGIFAKLEDINFFSRVQIHPDLKTIFWENGADISPCVLYDIISH